MKLLIVIVLAVVLIAILTTVWYDRYGGAGKDQTQHGISNYIASCENNINSYCRFNPGQDWSKEYEDCEEYIDRIDEQYVDDNGNPTCPGEPGDLIDGRPVSPRDPDDTETGACAERGGTCKDGDRSYYDTLFGNTVETSDCDNFCYVPAIHECRDRGGSCHKDGALESWMNDAETIDAECPQDGYSCWVKDEDQCRAMGGLCKDSNKDEWDSTGTTRDEYCGDGFCYLPPGTECERKYGGFCHSNVEKPQYEKLEGDIVQSDCDGFCYVPLEERDWSTCERPDYCVSPKFNEFCPDGTLDFRGEQDGCGELEGCCRRHDISDDEPSGDTLDIHFVPNGINDVDRYRSRVDRYIDGIQGLTPLNRCWDESVDVTVFDPDEERATTPDISIDVHERSKGEGNSYTLGEAYFISYGGNIDLWDSPADDELLSVVGAHEMSHVFGMCDEYSKEAWDVWDSSGSLSEHGICPNDWPSSDAWHGSTCSEFGGSGLDATCGRDLDGDSSSRASSIMGAGGDGAYDGLSGFHIPLTGLPESDQQFFLDQVEEHTGVTCE